MKKRPTYCKPALWLANTTPALRAGFRWLDFQSIPTKNYFHIKEGINIDWIYTLRPLVPRYCTWIRSSVRFFFYSSWRLTFFTSTLCFTSISCFDRRLNKEEKYGGPVRYPKWIFFMQVKNVNGNCGKDVSLVLTFQSCTPYMMQFQSVPSSHCFT